MSNKRRGPNGETALDGTPYVDNYTNMPWLEQKKMEFAIAHDHMTAADAAKISGVNKYVIRI